jgi:hypothetical protein
VEGKLLGGRSKVELPNLVIYPAEYLFRDSIQDLNGRFEGSIEGDKVSIRYISGKATITGTANEGGHSLNFTGEANLLEN